MPNQLAEEASPYLQQHADNPVDWYPWGEEAFSLAKKENKPVFLSIGYATCHWCHVMAHESFEDEGIAALMNEAFINIKVDREERPDLDSMYMTVCQMITGQGGWPLNVVLTPDKEPFYAATYIPKDSSPNRIGMRQLIPGIKGMWENEPDKIDKAFSKIKEGFKKTQTFESGPFPGTAACDYAAEQFGRRFDQKHGGFGNAPKFPSPHNLMFLLRQWKKTGEQRFLNMVTTTLREMRLGGIWDHIGFGFHRYSTDSEWLLPHFEKMLYDQALLMMAYTEAWQATREPLFRKTAEEIAEYVFRDLRHHDGGFYSAEDADSEGEEGKFYVWSTDELQQVLGQKDANTFNQIFNIEAEGNFREEATGQKTGANIPHLSNQLSNEQQQWFSDLRSLLLKHRSERIRPLLDDKILADWNGLMIAALAKAGQAFGNSTYLEKAIQAADFIEQNLYSEGNLMHRYRNGDSGIEAMADDYAFLCWGYLELYEATSEAQYLEKAHQIGNIFIEYFWDQEKGAFFLSRTDTDQVFGRQKQIYDGAIPSSNSVAMMNFLRLSRLTGNTDLETYTQHTGAYFSNDIIRSGASITHALQSVLYLNAEPEEITFIGSSEDLESLKASFSPDFHPFSVQHFISKGKASAIAELAPYTANQSMQEDVLTMYRCRNFSCDQPVIGLDSVLKAVGDL